MGRLTFLFLSFLTFLSVHDSCLYFCPLGGFSIFKGSLYTCPHLWDNLQMLSPCLSFAFWLGLLGCFVLFVLVVNVINLFPILFLDFERPFSLPGYKVIHHGILLWFHSGTRISDPFGVYFNVRIRHAFKLFQGAICPHIIYQKAYLLLRRK